MRISEIIYSSFVVVTQLLKHNTHFFYFKDIKKSHRHHMADVLNALHVQTKKKSGVNRPHHT